MAHYGLTWSLFWYLPNATIFQLYAELNFNCIIYNKRKLIYSLFCKPLTLSSLAALVQSSPQWLAAFEVFYLYNMSTIMLVKLGMSTPLWSWKHELSYHTKYEFILINLIYVTSRQRMPFQSKNDIFRKQSTRYCSLQ